MTTGLAAAEPSSSIPGMPRSIATAAGAGSPAVLGEVLLANLSWAEASASASRVDRKALTGNTIIELESGRAELVRVVEQGYALDLEERIRGVRCAAAPVRDHSGGVVAAVSAAGPAFRIEGDNLKHIVGFAKVPAASFSQALGYAAP